MTGGDENSIPAICIIICILISVTGYIRLSHVLLYYLLCYTLNQFRLVFCFALILISGCESELTPDVMARFIAEIRDYPTQTTSIAMKLFLDSLLAKAMTANNKDVTAANDIAPDVTPPSSPAVVVEDASSGVTGDRTDLGANDKTSDTAEAATEDSTSATKTCDLAVSDDTVGKHVSEVGHDSDVTNDDVLASSVADQPAVAVSDYPVPTEDVSPAETEDEKGARTDELPGKEKDFTALRQLQAFVDQLLR